MFGRLQEYLSPKVPQVIKNSYNNLKQKSYQTYINVLNSSFVQNVTSSYEWVTNNRYISNFFEGITQPLYYLPESLTAVKKSKKIRKAFYQGFITNAPLLFTSIAYWGFYRPFAQNFCDDDGYTLQTMDTAFSLYLASEVPKVLFNDAIDTVSFVDAIGEIPQNSKGYDCDCSNILKGRANFESNLIYLTNKTFIQAISVMPWIGTPTNWILSPWFLGLVLAEYHFTMCSPHRYESFSENNVYFFGLGSAINLLAYGASKGIEKVTGVNSWFVNLALQNCILKFGLLIAVLRDEPLPGKEFSIELLHYPRRMTEIAIQDGVNRLHHHFKSKKKLLPHQRVEQEEGHLQVYESIRSSLSQVSGIILGKEYAHLNTLVHTPSMRLFIHFKKDQIKAIVDIVRSAQKNMVLSFTTNLVDITPQFLYPTGVSKEEAALFGKLVYHRTAEKIVNVVDKMVDHALKDTEKVLAIEEQKQIVKEKALKEGKEAALFTAIKTSEEAPAQSHLVIDQKPVVVIEDHVPVPSNLLLGKDVRDKKLDAFTFAKIKEAVEQNSDYRYLPLVNYFRNYKTNHTVYFFSTGTQASPDKYAYACWIMGALDLKEFKTRIAQVPAKILESSFGHASFKTALNDVETRFIKAYEEDIQQKKSLVLK